MLYNLQNVANVQNFQLDNLVDFERSGKTRIYLQILVLIQPKTCNILAEFFVNFWDFFWKKSVKFPPAAIRARALPMQAVLGKVREALNRAGLFAIQCWLAVVNVLAHSLVRFSPEFGNSADARNSILAVSPPFKSSIFRY